MAPDFKTPALPRHAHREASAIKRTHQDAQIYAKDDPSSSYLTQLVSASRRAAKIERRIQARETRDLEPDWN